jgi:outer membrane protein assembly factor BamB
MIAIACNGTQGCKKLVVTGQKSGIVWALSAETGTVNWWTQVRRLVAYCQPTYVLITSALK